MKKTGIKEGLHLIIDCYGCELKKLNSGDCLKDLTHKVRKKIKMKALTKVIVKKGTPYLPGYSSLQMIETSHIAFHSFSDKLQLSGDIYSCKKFNAMEVLQMIKDRFNPSKIKSKILRRPL